MQYNDKGMISNLWIDEFDEYIISEIDSYAWGILLYLGYFVKTIFL